MRDKRPPTTLTEDEQLSLLRVTKDHVRGFRDHVIYSLALGTAMREFEIVALNVGDVFELDEKGAPKVRSIITLREFKGRSRKPGRKRPVPMQQEVHLPEALRYRLETFWRWKKAEGENLALDAPLFRSRESHRISKRMLVEAFRRWQIRAGFCRHLPFHSLRHTALTNLYRATKDIRVVQRQARHASIVTTTIYAGPSDEDMARAVRSLPC